MQSTWGAARQRRVRGGYFAHAKGKARTLILYDPQAKLPSDLGGDIYVPLERGKNQKAMFEKIESFLASQI